MKPRLLILAAIGSLDSSAQAPGERTIRLKRGRARAQMSSRWRAAATAAAREGERSFVRMFAT